MKIIQGMKKVKELQKKIEDVQDKISKNCAGMDNEKPSYADTAEEQDSVVNGWIQSVGDMVKEIITLRISIQKTNLETFVNVEVSPNNIVTHSIAEWIHRRRDLAQIQERTYLQLTNRGLKPYNYQEKDDSGKAIGPVLVCNARLYFSIKDRDDKIEEYKYEPSRIDAALEVANAETDLI